MLVLRRSFEPASYFCWNLPVSAMFGASSPLLPLFPLLMPRTASALLLTQRKPRPMCNRAKASLTRAAEAKREADATIKNHDKANARAHSALEHACCEREADKLPHLEDDSDNDDKSHVHDPTPLVQDTMLLHEAAVVINLHGQAFGMQNICTLISTILNDSNNYTLVWPIRPCP